MTAKLAAVAPLLLVVCGSLLYHIAAKSIPPAFDPVASLVGLYATALAGGPPTAIDEEFAVVHRVSSQRAFSRRHNSS